MRFNIPTPAPTFWQIVSMCSSQLIVSSSVTLKQEIECILGIGWPFNITGILWPACHCKITVEIRPIRAFHLCIFFCRMEKRLLFGRPSMERLKSWHIYWEKVQMWMAWIR